MLKEPVMPSSMKPNPNRLTLLALGLFLITSAACSLWTIGHVKDGVVIAVLRGGLSPRQAALSAIGPVDLALILATGLSALLLLALEIRRRAFSRLLATMRPQDAFAILTMLLVWTGQAYLFPGVLLAGDTATHISRLLEVAIGMQHGHLPAWTNNQYLGAPLLWFTGPLFYVVGGAVTLAIGNATLAAKAILFVLHLVTGWLYDLLLRRLGFGRLAALLAAICYSSCFAILHLFLFRGVFPQAFTIVFLIALFIAADGLLRTRGRIWAHSLVFSLSTAGLILNHQPHALFAALYLMIFAAAAMVTGLWSPRGLPRLIIAGALGVSMAAVAVLPTIAEADWVMITPDASPFNLQMPSLLRLSHLLLWHNTRTTWGFDYWAYIGIGLTLGCIGGLVALVRDRLDPQKQRIVIAAASCLVPCFFLYNQVVRDVLFLTFFAGMIAAAGFTWLEQTGQRGLLALASVLIILDVMSTSVQPVARTDKDFLIHAGSELRRTAPDQRVIQILLEPGQPPTADLGPDNYATAYEAPVARVAGNHNMAATHVHNYALAIIKQAEHDLRATGTLRAETRTVLAMLNTGRIICHSPIANGCPADFADTSEDPVLGRTVPITDATPVMFSQTLVEQNPALDLEKPMLWDHDFTTQAPSLRIAAINDTIAAWLAAERPDPQRRLSAALAVRARPADQNAPIAAPATIATATATTAPTTTAPTATGPATAGPATAGPVTTAQSTTGPATTVAGATGSVSTAPVSTAWNAVLEDYQVGLDTVRLRVRTDAPGFVQLAHPWYPAMIVRVNGTVVTPLRGTLDLMVIALPSGESTITLDLATTPIERQSMTISVIGLVMTLLYTLWLARSGSTAAAG